jgi:polyisoprenyl-phosphate glycosyltransferase
MSANDQDGSGTPRKLLSVVTPCFNEENNIETCWTRVRSIVETMQAYDYEHIFADNCSTDRTADILRKIAAQDHRVKVIFNAANFGAARSLLNAQRAASGDVVVAYMPADLQDPPELIPDMIALWERGYQVVYGVRADREENRLLFALRRIFYKLVNASARFQVPVNAGDFQVVDHTVIEALRHSRDYYPYVRGMIASYGFRSIGVNYKMTRRTADKSKANWFVLIDQAINAVISVSQTPLRIAMFVGFCLSLLSIIYGLMQLLLVLFFGVSAPPGITTLIIAFFFLSGGQLFFMGLIGEYVGAVHAMVRERPMVIEHERVNFAVVAVEGISGDSRRGLA